jgi:carbon-monoxide dehydrogenase small subunit
MKLSFRLNGKAIALECEPADTLAEVLRNTLNLNGTKVSCEVQVCGACTVLVEGVPVSACTYLAYEAREERHDYRRVRKVRRYTAPVAASVH